MSNRQPAILMWDGAKQVWVPKNRIIEVLNKEIAKRYEAMWNSVLDCYHREFLGILNSILENLDNAGTIQIYQDGVVRLHLEHEYYEEPRNIILVANEAEILALKRLYN